MKKLVISTLIVFILFNSGLNAQTKFSSTIPQDKKIYMLSEIWKEISYNFCDPQRLREIKWDSLYQSNINEVLNTKSDYEFYRLLQKFIASIGDGHTQLLIDDTEKNFNLGLLPIAFRNLGVKYYLFAFLNDYVKDIPLGSEVLQINDLPAQSYMEKFVLPYAHGNTPQWRMIYAMGSLFGSGAIGDSLKIQFKTTEGKSISAWFKYMEKEKFKSNFTLMPSLAPKARYEITKDSILYLKTNSFMSNASVKYLIKNAGIISRTKGVILDLRDNEGGSEEVADSLLMCFLNVESLKTYKSLTRKYNACAAAKGFGYPQFKSYYNNEVMDTIKEETYYKGELPTFTQPLVVLIGPKTFSAAEDFLLALKLNAPKRAVLIGTPTGGSTGAPLVRPLDKDKGISYRICTRKPFVEPSLFKSGIQPDIYYEKNIEEYLQNKDNIVDVATDILNKNNRK